jgi:hypothetical protein
LPCRILQVSIRGSACQEMRSQTYIWNVSSKPRKEYDQIQEDSLKELAYTSRPPHPTKVPGSILTTVQACSPMASFNTLPTHPFAVSPSSICRALGTSPVYHTPADPSAIYLPCLTNATRGTGVPAGLSISAKTAAGAEEGKEARRSAILGRDMLSNSVEFYGSM